MELDAIYSSREIDGRSRPSRGEISPPPTTRHVVGRGREKEDTVLRRVSFKLFASFFYTFFLFFFFFFYNSSITDVFRFWKWNNKFLLENWSKVKYQF